MRIPSIQEITGKALETFKKFPLVMLAAIIGTVVTIIFIESDSIKYNTLEYFNWQKFILLCAISIPLLSSVAFYNMRNKTKSTYLIIVYVLIILILTGYFFIFKNYESHFIRYSLYSISVYLFVTISAFMKIKNENGLWEFNKILFFRMLNSGLFTLLLYAGTIIAVAAVKELFKVEFSNNIYLEIFAIFVGLFNTWYFFSGVPENFEKSDNIIEYPKLLKLFSQYILIPLSVLYGLILYAYTIKIIVQWQLPIGWTSSLIIGYSGIGILAFLFLYPLRNEEGNKWAKVFSNLFFKLLFPLVILMALAVSRRISDYGITESRYFLVIITIWLFGITLYYTISKKKLLKLIPISLMIIAIVVSFGPWGAFSISENSQINRTVNFLKQNKIIENGKLNKEIKLKHKDYENLMSTLNYLENTHKLENLILELEKTTNSSFKISNDSLQKKQLLAVLAINKEKETENAKNYDFSLSDFKMKPVNIEDYEYVLHLDDDTFTENRKPKFTMMDKIIFVYFDNMKGEFIISKPDNEQNNIQFNMKEILYSFSARGIENLFSTDFQKVTENDSMKILLIINKLSGINQDESLKSINDLEVDLYIKFK